MPSGTIDSTIPQTSNTVNNTPTYITGFKTAVLNIFGIGDNTATTQCMTISAAGAIVIKVSPFTITGLATSGGASSLVVTPGAHTAVTAEVIDNNFAAHTMTITSGPISLQRFTSFAQPTITAASAQTVSTAATVNIDGAPIPTGAGPCTISNGYALRLGNGTLTASAATTLNTAATLYIAGSPVAGSNVTITTPYAAYLGESGAKTVTDYCVYIENLATSSTGSINKKGLYITSTGTWNGTSATNYGLHIGPCTGGTTNRGIYSEAQIESSVSTGTTPLVIASTTKVTNLNVDQVDGAHASATPTASTIPIADGSGKLDSWITQVARTANGSFAANGSNQVINCGFNPKWVTTFPNGSGTAISARNYYSTDDTDGLATPTMAHDTNPHGTLTATNVNAIITFTATGFTIYQPTDSTTCYWAAFG